MMFLIRHDLIRFIKSFYKLQAAILRTDSFTAANTGLAKVAV